MTKHPDLKQQFYFYAMSKIIKKGIPYTYQGRIIDIGVHIAEKPVFRKGDLVFKPYNSYYIRYGNDDNFSLWVTGEWFGQAVRRFFRQVRRMRIV